MSQYVWNASGNPGMLKRYVKLKNDLSWNTNGILLRNTACDIESWGIIMLFLITNAIIFVP